MVSVADPESVFILEKAVKATDEHRSSQIRSCEDNRSPPTGERPPSVKSVFICLSFRSPAQADVNLWLQFFSAHSTAGFKFIAVRSKFLVSLDHRFQKAPSHGGKNRRIGVFGGSGSGGGSCEGKMGFWTDWM
jgi:hypothetical protein